MKTKSIFTLILIAYSIFSFAQNENKNLLSSSLGIGTSNGSYGFYTGLKYERFVSGKFTIGLGVDHLSNHRFIGDKNYSYYYSENIFEKPDAPDEDRTFSSMGAYLNMNYFLVREDKDYLNIGLGAITNFYQDRYIQYIGGHGSSDSHVTISSTTRWEKINFRVSAEYTRFLNAYLGINFKTCYSFVGGETFAVMIGFSTRF